MSAAAVLRLVLRALAEADVPYRQLNDAAGVLAVRGRDIDDEYLDSWAADLDVVELLHRARDSASS